MLLARLLIGGIRAASAIVYRWVPRRIAALLGAVIFTVLLVTVVNGTLVSATISYRGDRATLAEARLHQGTGEASP
jgi:uncharacterized membrane protein